MFVRKKKNRSGTISVVVVDKYDGKSKELKTIGVSSDEEEVEHLYKLGKDWIEKRRGLEDMFRKVDYEKEEQEVVTRLLSNIENILINGHQLILSRVFDLIGFDQVGDDVLKQLVIARLSQPLSKAATVSYLKSHFDQDLDLSKLYRYMDKLYNTEQERVQQISVEHTRKLLGGKIGLMFYDVTTLYFETDYGDELRDTGFSKDGKHSQPQIVLGLLVSNNGYPLSYSIFNGSQYEGRTMLPIVEDFITRYHLDDFIVVADSGLMNKTNIVLLEQQGYRYIIGARIKNESKEIKQWCLSLAKINGAFYETNKSGSRLIVGYSEKRARKDAYNREKGVRRLEQAYKSGKINKQNINKRGYNKFLEITNDVCVNIDKTKVKEDEQWDGLKGYITNTDLPAEEVYNQYSNLWEVERAFRVTKGTLEMRPIFHFTPKRIEAHICICFVAYKVYKELERILKVRQINLSVDKVLSIARTITTIKIKLPLSDKTMVKTMVLTQEHQSIAPLFSDNFWNFR
ncbi:MAG: IS1634 family transposase [Saprospiraceae bacterium]|nr:IS1634 family transposase [Saprospiraceae bacterium]HMU99417.1 IS1634 family transposase [Chitinophagales bacterium]HNF41899.1 IS1634 family transposase [Bacteroidia bacterium]MBX7178386.1 IS1634 family transposase [Saprospiraceae bacterium]MCC7148615.1 IS1634 family transposase [Saprospiraceae bacterium]